MKSIHYKASLFLILSFISALGVFPYGYEFGMRFCKEGNTTCAMLLGFLFGATGTLLNMVLGYYSLLNYLKKNKHTNFYIKVVAIVSAIPIGCLCYYGYVNILPVYLTLVISITSMLVNASINQLAIQDFLSYLQKIMQENFSYGEIILRLIGFLVGFVVSVVSYLAANVGLSDMAINYKLAFAEKYHLIGFFAFLTWVPIAALFSYSTQEAVGKLYHSFQAYQKATIKRIAFNLVMLIICIVSGTAYFQITHNFYDVHKNIPEVFKAPYLQMFVHSFLEPLACLASAMVNFVYLKKLLAHAKAATSKQAKGNQNTLSKRLSIFIET